MHKYVPNYYNANLLPKEILKFLDNKITEYNNSSTNLELANYYNKIQKILDNRLKGNTYEITQYPNLYRISPPLNDWKLKIEINYYTKNNKFINSNITNYDWNNQLDSYFSSLLYTLKSIILKIIYYYKNTEIFTVFINTNFITKFIGNSKQQKHYPIYTFELPEISEIPNDFNMIGSNEANSGGYRLISHKHIMRKNKCSRTHKHNNRNKSKIRGFHRCKSIRKH